MEISASQLSARLADRAVEVCEMILPAGRLHGSEWLCGDVAGNAGDSLKVTLTGTHAGQWRDWANESDRGDLIDLWRIAKGITPGAAMKEVRAFLGIAEPARKTEKVEYAKAPAIRTAPPTEGGKARQWLTQARKIKPETIDAYRIETDPARKAVVFPSYSPSGEIVNRSYRTLDAKKQVWQDKGCAPSLFGWQSLTDEVYASKRILLAEGQIDAATWHQWGFPALSVPNGTACAWIEYEWENLSAFDTIYLAFDQDDAGRKITETAIARLGKHRCLIVSMPKKDANECLQAGFTATDAAQWIEGAKRPKLARLVTTAEMEERVISEIAPKPEPFSLPFFRGDWRDGDGFWFRPGEVTIWGGYTHAGKSTILNYFTAQALGSRIPVFIASFEIKVETQIRKLMEIFFGKNIPAEHAREFVRNVGESIVYADVVGSLPPDELMEMLWFAYRRYGAQHFFIDSLMRVQGLEDEWAKQGEFSNGLQAFAKETGSHVHLVAHLRKAGGASRPSLDAVKGSSLLTNNADNILIVLRNPEKEAAKKTGRKGPDVDEMHDSEVIVEKQRETGWTGLFRLDFDPAKLRFSKHEVKTTP